MKILLIGNTRLGDAILSTSILNYYSGSNLSITVVCSPLTENIYKNFSNVKDIIAVNKKKRGMHWLETYSLLERVCWDLVIDLRNSILSRLIRKKNVLRIGKVNPYKHRVESLCKLINTNEVISPYIPNSNTAEKEALRIISEKNLVKPILAIAPVTNWQRKNWPLENFVLLTNSLIKKSNDKNRFKDGPWCKVGDWVIFARYAGSRIEIEGGEVRLLNDDEVLATVQDPTDILHKF